MSILTINCGSSTLKFDLLSAGDEREQTRLAHGIVDRVGGPSASVSFTLAGGETQQSNLAVEDQGAALRQVVGVLRDTGLLDGVEAIGHRIVHGGPQFRASVVVDDEVVRAIEAASELAPLHNQPSLAALTAARAVFGPRMPMVAAFDTAFYADLPEVAAAYALPREVVQKYGIRRYGFHGLAHDYMVRRFRRLRPEVGAPRLVSFQLGNGCSATASRDGRAVDTSMGFTPLEGLVMGTRSGDLDPALPLFLAEKEGLTPEQTETLLNRRAGLLGVSGRSNDVRDLLSAAGAGDEAASLALELFCYRALKYLGAYTAVLRGVDAVLFGGGIGEHNPRLRGRICEGMSWAGLELDAERNAAATGSEARISADGAAVEVWVIPVDEASVIAADVVACLSRPSDDHSE